MKYLAVLLLLLIPIQPLSYAKYNWKRKNRLGAVGVVLLALTAFLVPSILIILR